MERSLCFPRSWCDGPSLFGRNRLKLVQVDWQRISYLEHFSQSRELDRLLDMHHAVFHGSLGEL